MPQVGQHRQPIRSADPQPPPSVAAPVSLANWVMPRARAKAYAQIVEGSSLPGRDAPRTNSRQTLLQQSACIAPPDAQRPSSVLTHANALSLTWSIDIAFGITRGSVP